MKKLFILSVLLIFSISFKANATHLMGGDITVGLDSGGSTYTLTLSLYRDVLGIPLYSAETVNMYAYNTTTGQYDFVTAYSIPQNTALSTTLLPSFPYGVEVGIYTQTLSLPAGKYQFIYNTCCRNYAIANASAPGTESLVLYTDLEVFSSTANSTPQCLTMPLAYFPINVPAYYNPLPYDIDGDSLAWSLDTPIGQTSYLYSPSPTPIRVAGFATPPGAATGPFTMNAYTGEITWTPNTLGNFIQAFKIDEYRGGTQIGSIIRDMQYVIIPDTSTDSIWCSAITATMHDASENTSYIYYTPGTEITYNIDGHCLRASDFLKLDAYGAPFTMASPATFTSSRVGTTISGTMKWTPPAGLTKDVIMVFRLTGGIFSTDYTLILRKDPHPSGVATVQGRQSTISVYPNPVHNNINITFNTIKAINSDISIYSVLGQKVKTIYNGYLPKGDHKLNDDINLPAGTYQVVVKDNGAVINTAHVVVE